MNKVTVEKLPSTKEIPGAKRWEEERGEFVQIAYQESMHHLAAFEIRKGYSRGSITMRKRKKSSMSFKGR